MGRTELCSCPARDGHRGAAAAVCRTEGAPGERLLGLRAAGQVPCASGAAGFRIRVCRARRGAAPRGIPVERPAVGAGNAGRSVCTVGNTSGRKGDHAIGTTDQCLSEKQKVKSGTDRGARGADVRTRTCMARTCVVRTSEGAVSSGTTARTCTAVLRSDDRGWAVATPSTGRERRCTPPSWLAPWRAPGESRPGPSMPRGERREETVYRHCAGDPVTDRRQFLTCGNAGMGARCRTNVRVADGGIMRRRHRTAGAAYRWPPRNARRPVHRSGAENRLPNRWWTPRGWLP